VIDEVFSDDGNNIKLDLMQDALAQYDEHEEVPEPHPSKLPVNLAMARLNIQHQSFEDWLRQKGRTFLDAHRQDVFEYYEHLRNEGQFDQLLDRATDEVFFLLFQNRNVLLIFSDMMAAELQRTADQPINDAENVREVQSAGRSAALLFLDGRSAPSISGIGGCAFFCHQDLTGVISVGSVDNYDHVVPLGRGGLNDVRTFSCYASRVTRKSEWASP
jgi:hypothetical protein